MLKKLRILKSGKNMKHKINKFMFWLPRILSILFIAFLMLFSLDVFDMNVGFWGTLLGLFIHNIPALILLVVLIISWKHEWFGGIVFILAGLLYIIFAMKGAPSIFLALSQGMIIAGPAFLIGILFLLNWQRKKKL